MEIKVTDKFKVKVDTYGNHQPVWYSEGGEVIEKGKFKGQESKPRWVEEGKYFNNLVKAIHWGINNGKIGDKILAEMTIEQYLKHLQDVYDQTKRLLRDSV